MHESPGEGRPPDAGSYERAAIAATLIRNLLGHGRGRDHGLKPGARSPGFPPGWPGLRVLPLPFQGPHSRVSAPARCASTATGPSPPAEAGEDQPCRPAGRGKRPVCSWPESQKSTRPETFLERFRAHRLPKIACILARFGCDAGLTMHHSASERSSSVTRTVCAPKLRTPPPLVMARRIWSSSRSGRRGLAASHGGGPG